MTTRRGLLGMLAAAPVAAPEIVKTAMETPDQRLAALNAMIESLPPAPEIFRQYISLDHGTWPLTEKDLPDITGALKALFDGTKEARARASRKWRKTNRKLDDDLAVNRSLSLTAKNRIQIERNIRRKLDADRDRERARFRTVTGKDWKP